MGGRAWSQEELIQLEELTETYPLATVAMNPPIPVGKCGLS